LAQQKGAFPVGKAPDFRAKSVFAVAGGIFDGRTRRLCIATNTRNRITSGGGQGGSHNGQNHKFAHLHLLET